MKIKNFLWLLILGVSAMSGLTSCDTEFDEVEQSIEIRKGTDGNGDGGGGHGGGIPPGGGG